MHTQEEWTSYLSDNNHHTLTSAYNQDGNRQSLALPGTTTLGYTYTVRNQLQAVTAGVGGANLVTYAYDLNGNFQTRTLYNSTSSTFVCDAMNRVTNITHNLASGDTRTFAYAYDNMGRRSWEQHDGGKADGFGYDLNSQITYFQDEGTLDQHGGLGNGTGTAYQFDAAGNRKSVTNGSGPTFYASNTLNQYGTVGGQTVGYDDNGNLANYNGTSYTYDSMNQLTDVSGSVSAHFVYDGLGRQIGRSIGGVTRFSVWDGSHLFAEYQPGNVLNRRMVYGAGGDLALDSYNNLYYYANAHGSTSHLAGSDGKLKESYTYDLDGTPTVYNADGTVRAAGSAFISNFFTGQQWYSALKLYDLRHRAYLPSLGRFLQPDPIGFKGDAANLYRYCGNNAVNLSDPSGTFAVYHQDGDYYSYRVPGDFTQLIGLIGSHVVDSEGNRLACAGTAQAKAGAYDANGVFHDVPLTRLNHQPNWFQGETLNYTMAPGTLVATGWADDGSYPNAPTGNHTLWLLGYDAQGNAYLLSATKTTDVHLSIIQPKDQWQFNEVDTPGDRPAYDPAPSTAIALAGKTDTGEPIYEGRVVTSIDQDFFGSGTLETQNASGLQGSGRNDWLRHRHKH
ncbi:MAG TPA: RHS repeat-associated core domain-containing protein [Chthoniobacterales bacterium]|jgi:RHS repeat-associated protein